MKYFKFLLPLSLFIFVLGCNNSEQKYVSSDLFPEFPVPKEAQLVEQKEDRYEKYRYNAQGGTHGIRDDYYKAIENWEWKELKDLRMGTYHVFERNSIYIGMSVHGSSEGDFFTINKGRENIGFDIRTFGKKHPELEKAMLDLLNNSSGESYIFSEKTAGLLNGVSVSDDGVAVVDFVNFSHIIPNAGTSAGKAEMFKSLNSVVFQFDNIEQVYYQFDGSHSDWAYWLEAVEGPVTREQYYKFNQSSDIKNPSLNKECDQNVNHYDEISPEFTKDNVVFGQTAKEVINFWGKPCFVGENAENGIPLWLYNFPTEQGYVYNPPNTIQLIDTEGLKSGKMKAQLMIGFYHDQIAYYHLKYKNDEGKVISVSDAPEELKPILYD